MAKRALVRHIPKDFDAWAYSIAWPQKQALSPLAGRVSFAVEDIKFAYNAWCLLRLAMFFGVYHPKVLSGLHNTTPSMDIALAGNRLFYMHASVEAQLCPAKVKIALTPNHPRAFPIQEFSWSTHCTHHRPEATGVELVLGMENGLSKSVVDACDHCMYIPQYGSIGSLSMLSALAIATHTVARSLQQRGSEHSAPQELASQGHMPLSNGPLKRDDSLPHEADLLACSNCEIKEVLRSRRAAYQLQLSVILYNDLGDRNIGAVMRNANVFNCAFVAVVNRKRFNRRGALGTQKVLDVRFLETVFEEEAQALLDGYEVWLLYPYYPNLVIYGTDPDFFEANQLSTFLRHNDPSLSAWGATRHHLVETHPLIEAHPHLQYNPVHLDNTESLVSAVQEVKRRGRKGILLAVPEEGCSPHPSFSRISQRVVYVSHPSSLPHTSQRGLNPALSTAIGLERIRCAIDALA